MIAEPSMPDRRPSPGLSLNLNSNNPFRNRAASPAIPSPSLNNPTSGGRPQSRNPFLSAHEESSRPTELIDMSATLKESPKKATFGASAEELFKNLSFDDKSGEQKGPPRRYPPGRSGTLPSGGHRPSRSQEDEKRRERSQGPPRPRGPPGSKLAPGSMERRENRRPRRNSESSMIDKGSLDPEEERKRRERRKERDARGKDGKSKRIRKPGGLDLIDKLDVSGIYGPSLFHHDGPFDACNPHRNRRKDHRAPMQAFPVNSANNALGGSGPVNKTLDLQQFHGLGAEGFTDFATTNAESTEIGKKRPSIEGRSVTFNPGLRVEPVHGEESAGLGSSTFLEGAPASRTAMQRRDSENEAATLQGGGIGRKKSIAQRIRGISQPRRGFADGNPRITSPESRWPNGQRTPGSPPEVPAKGPQSAGGAQNLNESNPFFDDYDEAYEKKGAAIKVAETQGPSGPVKSPSSPPALRGNGLVRSMTADSFDAQDAGKANTGFLSRVKSLKGGRRPRPERPT